MITYQTHRNKVYKHTIPQLKVNKPVKEIHLIKVKVKAKTIVKVKTKLMRKTQLAKVKINKKLKKK